MRSICLASLLALGCGSNGAPAASSTIALSSDDRTLWVVNPDADSVNTVMGATRPTALAYQTFAFAAALRASSGRLIAEYDINRNHNGRDMLGNPVNLPSNDFIIRGEISF